MADQPEATQTPVEDQTPAETQTSEATQTTVAAPAPALAEQAPISEPATEEEEPLEFEIDVKTLTGRVFTFKVDATWTIEKLKQEIEKSEGITPSQQKLVHKGKQLNNDNQTLEENGIIAKTTLHLVLALRGGRNL